MKNQRNVQSYGAAPRAQRGLPAEATRESRRSAEAGIVKLEKRHTPWWIAEGSSSPTGWLVWRGGW